MDPNLPQQPPPLAQTSWWNRNWKWFVPTGCGGCLLLIVGFGLCMVIFAFGLMKSTDVYKTAVARAKENPEVQAALGTPIKEGFWVGGKTETNPASGEANLSIPISGPKGKGTIYVSAEKKAGRWSYNTLEVEVAGRKERIDLSSD